jgi:hypothetical protein
MESEEIDPDDTQAVANTVVRHVTTTLARQAHNLDTVGCSDSIPFDTDEFLSLQLIKLRPCQFETSS